MTTNFGTIKDIAIEALIKGTTGKNKMTKIFEVFSKRVNSSPILKTQFLVYNNLATKNFETKESAQIYLNENARLFNDFSRVNILKENEMLASNMINAIDMLIEQYNKFQVNGGHESGDYANGYEQALHGVVDDLIMLKEKLNKGTLEEGLNKDINTLIVESTKSNKLPNIETKTKSIGVLLETLTTKPIIKESKTIDSNLPAEFIIKKATEIFNEKFSFLNETEKNILKAILNEDTTKQEEIYKQLVTENINLIKRKLIEQSEGMEEDVLNKLTLTESKLKGLTYSKAISIQDYVKLMNLQSELAK